MTNIDAELTIARPREYHLSVDDIRRHPGFAQSCDLFIDEMVNLYGSDQRLLRGLGEMVRGITFMIIICLDAAYDPEDPATYPTFSLLRTTLEKMGIANHRRILDLVRGMQEDGFVTKHPSTSDKRSHFLRPTEKMLASDREWLAAHHAALAFLYPDTLPYKLAMTRDRAYQRAYRRASLRSIEVGNDILGKNPAILFFLTNEVGYRVLMVLMRVVRGKAVARTEPGFFSFAAQQARVSRTHVRNLLKGASRLGLVAFSEKPGEFVEVLEPLQDGMVRWIAANLSGIDLVSRRAMCDLGASSSSL